MDDIDAELEADWQTLTSWALLYRQALNELNVQFGLESLRSGIYLPCDEVYHKVLFPDDSSARLRGALNSTNADIRPKLIARIRELAAIARKELVP